MLIPNPSLLLSIKAFEKFVWWVVGGKLVENNFSVQLKLKPS